MAHVRWLVTPALDPICLAFDDGIPVAAALGGQAVDSLRTGYGFHDPRLDQFPESGEIPIIRRDRPLLALDMEAEHGDSQLGQRLGLHLGSLLAPIVPPQGSRRNAD